jgi:hypothetical protein
MVRHWCLSQRLEGKQDGTVGRFFEPRANHERGHLGLSHVDNLDKGLYDNHKTARDSHGPPCMERMGLIILWNHSPIAFFGDFPRITIDEEMLICIGN